MKHFGDITKLKGSEVPCVDIVTGGSPCQDLSVAGKRAGLEGERSGLFMEQIRLIKEMRDESIRRLQSAGADVDRRMVKPRFMVWENVPGAFSSNKGEDFRIVLEETARVADKSAVIPGPPKGKWSNSGCILGNGWSIAWRVHDAQFWGVPQRRRRIALVADFIGGAAPEILFERKSMSGDSEEGREPRKDSAGDVETGTTETSKCLNSWDVQSKHIQSENGVAEALYSGECRGGGGESYVLSSANNQPVAYGISSYCSNGMKSDNPKSGFYEAKTSRTLDLNGGSPACNQGGIAVVQGADMYNGNLTGNVAATLNATSGDSPTHSGSSVVCLEGNGSRPSHKGDGYSESETMYTLNSTEKHAVCTKGGSEPTIASKASFFLKSRSDGTADTLVATDYKDPQIVCYGIDRASFNQGKNAKFGFSIEEDLAQTIVAKGPGG